MGVLTLLTDPNFLRQGQRAYVGHGLVSKRLTEPALGIAHLPALDAVLLSHVHGDHWDRVAQAGLDHARACPWWARKPRGPCTISPVLTSYRLWCHGNTKHPAASRCPWLRSAS